MAYDINEIAGILNKIREENAQNADGFNKLLVTLNNKIEIISEDSETVDMLKLYISELKKLINEKHNLSNDKLQILENYLENIVLLNEQNASKSDIKSLFNNFDLHSKNFFEEVSQQKNFIEKISSQLDSLKSETLNKEDISSLLDKVSSKIIELIKIQENSIAEVSQMRNEFHQTAESDLENYSRIIQNISSVSEKLNDIDKTEDIKEFFTEHASSNCQNIINEILVLKEELNLVLKNEEDKEIEHFSKLNEELSELANTVNTVQNSYKENSENSLKNLQTVCENFVDFKDHINDIAANIKDYIFELNNSYKDIQNSNGNKICEKLTDLEASFVHNSEIYEQKTDILQNKLSQFVQLLEDNSSNTKEQINQNFENILTIKDDLQQLNNLLKSSKLSNDENFNKLISYIDTEIENVNININNICESLNGKISSSIEEKLNPIQENFNEITQIIEQSKGEFSTIKEILLNEINEKLYNIKEEFININNDLLNSMYCKAEEIVTAICDVKNCLEDYSQFDYERITKDLKSQIELSFMNFSVDLNAEITAKTDILSRMEQAYKEIFNKISLIEEIVGENLKNNLETLNVTINSNAKNLKDYISENIETNLNDLKEYINVKFDNKDIMLKLDSTRDELYNKLENVLNEQSAQSEQTGILASNLEELGTDLKIFVQSTYKESENIDNKLNNLSDTNVKVTQILSAINTKVDVLADDNSYYDLCNELDDIKALISEQRKYFETYSDEKTEIIDKYLQEVQQKLENIDLEKNSQDIKNSIMNVLLSLVDQISFVEETEEIKDFVEEKTDEINKNLIVVQNQLKQITSPDDDFSYSYTLQDVESDIAKLRLDISHMSGSDFDDISDDIKKIVKAVDNLETSLTQDEIAGLQGDIEKLSEDILSISSRTNKLLLTSDESNKALNDGLNNFSSAICKLEDRINFLDNTQINERLEKKIDKIQSMVIDSTNTGKVMHQAMMYLGEWIDSTTENISDITDKTSQIPNIQEEINVLKNIIPDRIELINKLENKFEEQENRIDRLEMKIEKILSTLEEKDDMILNRKVEKIEKLISKLNTNIEKLTSYVDEE